jgi:N-acetylneuraminate synthase
MMPLIIAEAGINHNGCYETAIKLVNEAIKAKADIIKFQIFNSSSLVTPNAEKAEYQKENTEKEDSQLSMLRSLELSNSEFIKIKDHCEKNNIEFLATAFDDNSLNFLTDTLNVNYLKIPSGELTNLPFIMRHAKKNIPLIISTGMANNVDIENALAVITYARNFPNKTPKNFNELKILAQDLPPPNNITLLHCTTSYPTPFEDANLLAIKTMQDKFKCDIGYSDHTQGILAPVIATSLGAKIIEKHITLDKTQPGPDHSSSIDTNELKQMISAIRQTKTLLGSHEKKISFSESKNLVSARKSIVASKSVEKGELLNSKNLTCKRPGNGTPPEKYWELLNTKATRSYKENDKVY